MPRANATTAQYQEIRKQEIKGIESAYDAIFANPGLIGMTSIEPFKPKITALIVTKRHHTRFYPMTEDAKTNCKHGTVVDSAVCHPYYFDFFLQSHHAVTGTARSTYYFVLENGMGFTPEDLQNFTNMLCYTYVRATLPVGYAPPTYYADRLCDRARAYMRDSFEAKRKKQRAQKESRDPDDVHSESDEEIKELTPEELKKEKSVAWYERYNANGGKEANPVGPWHKNMNNTMFWM